MREQVALHLLQDALSTALGPGYTVNSNFLTSSLRNQRQGMADLVIWHKDDGNPFIIEYKGSKKTAPVPLHAVLQLLHVAEANKDFEPRLILATTGTVNMLARDEAASKGIFVVEAEGLEEMTHKLAAFISDSISRAPEPMGPRDIS